MTWRTSTQSMPMPNAMVHITTRRGAWLVPKEVTIESRMDFRVTPVYMSTRRNIAKFGAPTGSVNSGFSEE